ncbi:MAG: membrane protein insertion efficiency factor YidD [Gammaproteobacteria bacterium]
MRSILIFLIKTYKLIVSPFMGQNCRFHPSCSNYSMEAIRIHGAFKGVVLSLRRILKCQPMHPGGYDPVPDHFSSQSAGSVQRRISKPRA